MIPLPTLQYGPGMHNRISGPMNSRGALCGENIAAPGFSFFGSLLHQSQASIPLSLHVSITTRRL